MPVFSLSKKIIFPPPHLAISEGLLAVGGDLSPGRLVAAYRSGIFPWYSEGEPILWWSPDPRLVLYPDELHVSRSLKKAIRQQRFKITMDTEFDAVIRHCALVPRKDQPGTWITDEMISAYIRLHRLGIAHSVEAWAGGELSGGLYGVSLGRCFFGESMFSSQTDASKVALVHLVDFLREHRFGLIDCQVSSEHLMRLGAREVPRKMFLKQVEKFCAKPGPVGRWTA